MALGFIGDIIGDIARSLYGSLPPEISSLYKDDLPQVESPDITFQPFTVTGPGGSQVRTTADGSTSYALSPEQQAMQQQLFGGAQSMFQGAMGPTADREAAIYDRMRAAQMPEEARQRAALEERLAAQGRLGVRTNQFGGTPEQLAMAKAQAEAQNTAMLGAMQQAQAEQEQQAMLGGQFLQQSYAPQAALLSMMSPALNVAGLSDVARRQQGEFDLETAMANLQGEMGQRAGLANLYGGLFSGAAGMAGGFGQGLLDILGF
jgi:hypothetical protein